MPERVVLATLDFDERGALRGVKAIEQGIGSLERQTNTTAQAFSQRMFSMRSAAQAFLGGFTLAGAIVGLKNFTVEIAKTDTAFLQFSESVKTANRAVQDFFRPFVHEALIAAATGINAIGSAFSQFFASFKSGYDALGAKGKAAFWTLTALLGGKTGAGFAKSMLGMGDATLAEAPGPLYGPFDARTYGPQMPKTQYDREGRPFAPTAQRIDEGVNIKDFGWLDDLAQKERALTSDTFDLRDALVAMPEALATFRDGVDDINPALVTANQNLNDLIAQYEYFQTVVVAASEASAAAVMSGAMSTSAAARLMEAIRAAEAIQLGMIELAKAAAAAASYQYGSAALHRVSAGLFFAAAAMHGVAAIKPASYGVSGGGGSLGGAAAGEQGQQQPRNVTVYVTVEGHVLSQGNFVRDITREINKQLSDGAQGGRFAA